MDAQVWVVDNNSVDGSVALVKEKFPWVKLIANHDNPGFSKANNQAIRKSSGEYILLLNPDTVVQEDTFKQVVDFMDQHPDAGGLGVKMVDGKGTYLPESKRGLPNPGVSFCKIFGIHKIFPRSKRFNWYYMGHLDKNEVNPVEILSGAFMLMRKEALDKVGLLDETFFMYGEDIDLSWRIIQGGYQNYYYPNTSIIHYKGESTKKGSLNYVFVFYNAMIIFARKHFSEKNAKAYSMLINLAIYLRAGVAIVRRFLERIWLPALDFGLIVAGLFAVKSFYETWQNKIYDFHLVTLAFMGYSLIWTWGNYLSGAYDKPAKIIRVLRGTAIGTGVILAVYSLLPESLRFSRALILLGAAVVLLEYFLTRGILGVIKSELGFSRTSNKRFIIIGLQDEALRVGKLLSQTQYEIGEIRVIDPKGEELDNLSDITRVYNFEEIIFCAKDLSSGDIIGLMSTLEDLRVDFKIAPPESLYIIGSNSIHTAADIFILDINSVSRRENRRKKRLLDVLMSIGLIISFPVTAFLVRRPGVFFRNCLSVLVGKKTWVGFDQTALGDRRLPSIRPGVLTPNLSSSKGLSTEDTARKLNVLYAKDYRVVNDLNIIFKSFSSLGTA